MNEVADRLHPLPAGRCLPEQPPGVVGQAIGFAVSAAEQKQQRVYGQVLNRMLLGSDIGWVRLACVSDDGLRSQAERAGGRDEPIAPVAEAVTVALEWDGGRGDDIVRLLQVRDARGMDIEHDDHGSGLPQLIRHLAANSNAHDPSCALGATRLGVTQGERKPQFRALWPGANLRLRLTSSFH